MVINLSESIRKQLTDCELILDLHITNLDAPSNIHQTPEVVLLSHEREKKKKYLQACLDQRRQFSPFVLSCDRVLGNKAKVVEYYKTLQEASPIYQESPFHATLLCSASEDHASPLWANIPSGKMEPASACSTFGEQQQHILKIKRFQKIKN